MDKIMINIKDNGRYSDVALLVDKVEYGEMIDFWRKEMNITKPIRLREYWKHSSIIAWQSKVRDFLLNEKEGLEARQWHTENSNEIEAIENRLNGYQINPHFFFNEIVNIILKKFNKGDEFKSVVIKSLLFCKIKENDYIFRKIRLGVKNIRRDRKWYWWNRRPKKYGYKKIAKLTNNEKSTIEGAIKSYIKKLEGS
jgi:hypothetical protein